MKLPERQGQKPKGVVLNSHHGNAEFFLSLFLNFSMHYSFECSAYIVGTGVMCALGNWSVAAS